VEGVVRVSVIFGVNDTEFAAVRRLAILGDGLEAVILEDLVMFELAASGMIAEVDSVFTF